MAAFVPPTFRPPTQEEVTQSPGYQFRLQAGTDALNRAAAAKGVLRTGGTLKDILGYGQDLASQEYGSEYDRRLKAYDMERQNALDKWQADWQQYVFNNTPRGGGGGGGGPDMPPPPDAPDYGPPDGYEDPSGGDPYGGGPYNSGPRKPPGPYGRDDGGDYY